MMHSLACLPRTPVIITRITTLVGALLILSACSGGPADKPRPEPVTTPETLLQRGIQSFGDNDLAEARRHFRQALLLYRNIDDPDGIIRSCLNLAKVNMAVHNDATAAIYLDRAEQTAAANGLTGYDQHIAIQRSSLLIRQGNTTAAADMLLAPLNSSDSMTRLAALKNRTVIAFTTNDRDRTQWLESYRKENASTGNHPSHRARILRFDAELAGDLDDQDRLLQQALQISRQAADSLAIAATLAQWGDLALSADKLAAAEDRYLRALFIRHQFGDVHNTTRLLEKLRDVYSRQTADTNAAARLDRTQQWLDRIGRNQLADWPQLIADFDYYPH